MPASPPDLDKDVLVLLYDVARMIRRRADQIARQHGTTRAQWVVLARLWSRPGLSQAELAAAAEVEPITIGRLIDRMEARGMVERRPDPKDRRLRRLFLTEEAKPLLEEVGSFRSELHEIALGGLAADDLTTVARTLHTIRANLSDDKCQHAPNRALSESIQS